MVKISWYDKHDEESYMNDDGHDNFDKKNGSHEIFSNFIRRSWSPQLRGSLEISLVKRERIP